MKHTGISKDTLELLRRSDTPTVCNVIELFDVRRRASGYMDGSIRACFPDLPPMVGFASTATYRSSAPAASTDCVTMVQQVASFEDVPGPPVVVFQDLDVPSAAATFGEVMSTTYKSFGAAGLITSGAGRDMQQVQALKFPVFSNGINCSHGYWQIPSINVPVEVGGITIRPGDLLHGDCNGVTTIPLDIAAYVAEECEAFMKAEAVIFDYLKGGNVTVAGLARACVECDRLFDEIKARAAKKRTRGK